MEMTNEELRKQIAELEAKLAQSRTNKLSIKVSEKNETVVSVYGLGRFPVSLHGGQWQRLLAFANDINAFIKQHPEVLVDARVKAA